MATKFINNDAESHEFDLNKVEDFECRCLNTLELNDQDEELITKELAELPKQMSSNIGFSILTCQRQMVQIGIYCSTFRHLIILFQYPKGYPLVPIIMQFKSKTMSQELLKGLLIKCDAKAKMINGDAHIYKICLFVKQFLEENPFSACSDELSYVKSLLDPETDKIKLRLKSGIILINLVKKQYFFEIKLIIPFDYPVQPVSISLKNSNVPKNVSTMFIAQSAELARKCVEPPIKGKDKDFIAKPSLKQVVEFLIEKCMNRCVTDHCPICKKLSLPLIPPDDISQGDPNFPVQVLCCSQLYHYDCLDHYIKSPPFVQTKKCLICGKDIYHNYWKKSQKLMEEKWVYTQAKNRELDDVADFFS